MKDVCDTAELKIACLLLQFLLNWEGLKSGLIIHDSAVSSSPGEIGRRYLT